MSSNIHILGLGSVGILVAHALAKLRQCPKLTLMFHRSLNIQGNPTELCVSAGSSKHQCTGFEIEQLCDNFWKRLPDQNNPAETQVDDIPIDALILAVKANYTTSALQTIKHRLSKKSTILFMQNGMGILEEVDAVFPDPAERPNYMVGINTHGTVRSGPLSAHHVSPGEITYGVAPRILGDYGDGGTLRVQDDSATLSIKSARSLVDALNQVDHLNIRQVGAEEILYLQMRKVAINAVLNPLTAILECDVGTLCSSSSPNIQTLIDRILIEASSVFMAFPVPLHISKHLEVKMDKQQIADTLRVVSEKLWTHKPSMMWDVSKGVQTEIDYLNGFLVKWGAKLGVDCPVNDLVVRLLHAKERSRGVAKSGEI